ncbi:MAG: hypothetical protein U0441_21145 [Polyangiaceae bacterium]
MQDIPSRFTRLFDEIARRPEITVTTRSIRPGLSDGEIRELEEGLEIELAPAIRQFYLQTNGISLAWSADVTALGEGFSEEDDGYVGGSIAVLDMFTMVMGRKGQKWAGELFFDFMSAEQQAPFRRFVPFDHTGELAAGFLVDGHRIGPKMRLFDAHEGIVPFEYDIDTYLERTLETRGFHHWPLFFADDGSLERARYDRARTRLFG